MKLVTPHNGHPAKPRRLSVLVTIFASRKLLISSALAGAVLLFLYAKTLPVVFDATATVLPPEHSNSGGMLAFLANTTSAFDFLKGAAGADNPMLDLYKTIIESRTIAEDVTRDSSVSAFLIRSDTSLKGRVERLRGSLASEVLRTGAFNISVRLRTSRFPSSRELDSVRIMTARVTNAYVTALDHYNRSRLMTSARSTRIFIEGEYHGKMASLDSAYGRLQAFQEEHKAISLPEQLTATVSAAAKLAGQIQQTQMQIGVEEHELGASSPRVKVLNAQLQAAKEQLSKFDDGSAGDYIIALRTAPALTRQLAGLLREVKVLEQVSGYLRQQFEEQRINEERDLPSLQVLDLAQPPTGPSGPNTKLYALIGLVLGFIGAIGFISIRSYVIDVREHPQAHYRLLNVMRTVRHGKKATLLEPSAADPSLLDPIETSSGLDR